MKFNFNFLWAPLSLARSLARSVSQNLQPLSKQRMLGTQFLVCTASSFKALTDRWNVTSSSCSTVAPYFSVGLGCCKSTRCRFGPKAKPILISCKSSRRGNSSGGRFSDLHDDDPDRHDYLQASLLISETLTHHRIWRQGFSEEMRFRAKGSRQLPDMSLIRHDEFLRRFDSPTIFLKISCDGDFLLPVIVGEFAIETLVDSLKGVNDGDCPDQFLLVKNIVETLGYEVKMVRITEGVSSMYFARLYFSRQGENGVLSVDVQLSDAINVAHRFKVPIYVNKQIVLTDAIKIGYGMGRGHGSKPTYDVSLDSAADGPDMLNQELDLIRNMNLAVKEERYNDAAMWRDKIIEFRKSRHEH
uniref:Uncharacterized protein MANES_02G110900 n=1 Tax=Rhizophora mucronata TaxID=61149 RepID=A0A2P2J9R7_RHIMU